MHTCLGLGCLSRPWVQQAAAQTARSPPPPLFWPHLSSSHILPEWHLLSHPLQPKLLLQTPSLLPFLPPSVSPLTCGLPVLPSSPSTDLPRAGLPVPPSAASEPLCHGLITCTPYTCPSRRPFWNLGLCPALCCLRWDSLSQRSSCTRL